MIKGLEALETLGLVQNKYSGYLVNYEFKEEYSIIEKELQRLETIDNTNPNEALEGLKTSLHNEWLRFYPQFKKFDETTKIVDGRRMIKSDADNYLTIKQALIKSQEQEKENKLLKEIIKSLFDRGCPLHQYIDPEFGLTIEVDDECSIMHLGEFNGVDLDKKLKEVLENE